MKILWMSDSPTSPSGFGNVTRFVCAGLAERGHQVAILGWQARGEPIAWQGCTIYPVRFDGFGADVLLTYLRRLQPDVLVTLADVWWLTFITDPTIATFMRTAAIPWALYYPIDGDMGDGRLPPSWVHILQTVDLPIAMSAYGREVSRANGIEPALINHGVDTTIFRPPVDRAAAKRRHGYEGNFVVLSDARNQPRKLLPRTLEIFRRFAADKPDARLHLHCDADDPAARAPDYHYCLRADIELLGLSDQVRLTAGHSMSKGLSLPELAGLYQAADVHLLSSWGEGFGLPTLQASASGVVPLASAYTASLELTAGHGGPIPIRHYLPDQFGLRRAWIDIDAAVAQLGALYADRPQLAARAAAARRFAEGYDWAQIVPQWHDLLEQEVPRRRQRRHWLGTRATVTLGAGAPAHPPVISQVAEVVRGVVPGLPEGVRVTIDVVESKSGQLLGELLRDATVVEQRLTIPVTLESAAPVLVKRRETGLVYAASAADLDAVGRLYAIFPGLHLWSTVDLSGTGRASGPPAGSPAYQRRLAASTLALDLTGADPQLPAQAAALGVPCIGRQTQPDQARLWPELSLTMADSEAAARLGRWLLTDQGESQRLCERARTMLAVAGAADEGGG